MRTRLHSAWLYFWGSIGVLSAMPIETAEMQNPSYNPNDAILRTSHDGCPCDAIIHRMMTGDWFGLRRELCERGIDFNLNTSFDLAGNPVGGMSRGFSNTGSTHLGASADFGRLVGESWNGWMAFVSAVWRYGDSLTLDRVGNQFNVQQNYGGQNLRLYGLFLQRELLDKRLQIKVGRFASGDDFLSRPYYWNYMNNAIDGNPVAAFYNHTGFSAYPNATWAAFARYSPTDEFKFGVGVYEILDPSQTRNDMHGLGFSMKNGEGVNVNAQATWHPKRGLGGMPGSYSLGLSAGWTAPYTLNDRDTYTQNLQCWLMLEQFVYQPDANDPERGVMPWVAVVYAPWGERSEMPFFVAGGVSAPGMIPERPDDVLGFGFAYGKYSPFLSGARAAQANGYEAMFELHYKWQATPWCAVMPNVQFILNPSGGAYPDALVLGAQIGIVF